MKADLCRLVLPVLCVAASGCVATFAPPSTPDSPTLTITTSMNTLRFFENGADCSGPAKIPAEYIQDGRVVSLPLPAEREVALHSGYASGAVGLVTTCQLFVSFTPLANFDYDLRFSYPRGSQVCHASLYRKDRVGGGTTIDTSMRLREKLTPLLESQPFCAR